MKVPFMKKMKSLGFVTIKRYKLKYVFSFYLEVIIMLIPNDLIKKFNSNCDKNINNLNNKNFYLFILVILLIFIFYFIIIKF